MTSSKYNKFCIRFIGDLKTKTTNTQTTSTLKLCENLFSHLGAYIGISKQVNSVMVYDFVRSTPNDCSNTDQKQRKDRQPNEGKYRVQRPTNQSIRTQVFIFLSPSFQYLEIGNTSQAQVNYGSVDITRRNLATKCKCTRRPTVKATAT